MGENIGPGDGDARPSASGTQRPSSEQGGDSVDDLMVHLRGGPQGAPPDRRRPRRADVVTYRVRVEIDGTQPPVWRRLELASDLMLPEVHEVLQVAFGWEDAHLHRFASGPSLYSRQNQDFLSDFDFEDGDVGVDEGEVRLDEVLVEPGERLFYLYDFGDSWEHVITLQHVQPRSPDAPRAVCTAGRRPAPAEDCGGVEGYEFMAAVNDPEHPEHTAALAEFHREYGDLAPEAFAPTPLNIEATNAALAALFEAPPLPGPLADLLTPLPPGPRRRLTGLLAQAHLDQPAEIDPGVAECIVWPYAWLLDHVGTDGLALTQAGYLPPASVQAASAALDLDREWIGKHNRENQTLPVYHLRTSAQHLGLLRKYRGRLLRTPAGRTAHGDPQTLYQHLARHLPWRTAKEHERHAALLVLSCTAAEQPTGFTEIADLLTALGWRLDGHDPLDANHAFDAARDIVEVLRRIGAATTTEWPPALHPLQPDGPAFARTALQSWPT